MLTGKHPQALANIVNERIREIFKKSLTHVNLVDYRIFQADPQRIFQFRRGSEEAGRMLVVFLWPPNSEVVCYGNSSRFPLDTVPSDNGLFRVVNASFKKVQAACMEKTIHLRDGGL